MPITTIPKQVRLNAYKFLLEKCRTATDRKQTFCGTCMQLDTYAVSQNIFGKNSKPYNTELWPEFLAQKPSHPHSLYSWWPVSLAGNQHRISALENAIRLCGGKID